ncbi:hypothetical protein ENSA7_64030 [Enhygromyxa salina]|uniref:Uncharacterized protein n=2 Tax=Enhygromyxa salina TaxID=215803 RepID=A0A2S9Y2V1_9BACT|nr:hypothetical protein ENSA7_64030 [Enhygromyxa salina]
MMLLGFAGMLGFAGLALWLGLLHRRETKRTSAAASTSRTTPPATRETSPTPAAAPHQPEYHDPTEFVALPGQRELDAPLGSGIGTEIMMAIPDDPYADTRIAPGSATPGAATPGDRTEVVAARLGAEPEPALEPSDRTAMIPSAELLARQRGASPASTELEPDDKPDDKTAFVAPPPPDDRTAFIAPPPAASQTAFIAPPPADGRTAFVAPPPADDRPSLVAPSPAASQTAFVAPPREPSQTALITPPPAVSRTAFVAPPPAAPTLARPAAPPAVAAPTTTAPSPTFTEKSVIPTPAPPSVSTSAPSVDLAEHFSLAATAYEQLQNATTSASLEAWRGHLEVLASVPSEQLEAHLRPELSSLPNHRSAAALLALLHSKSWPAKRAFPQLVAELEPDLRAGALRVLRSWDDPRAQSIAAAGLATAQTDQLRATWLECFADHGWDPGAAAIDAALAHADPQVVRAGLRALPHCEAAPRLEPKLANHLFAGDPGVRAQAIETALLFANNSAWLVCHQLARNPSFPSAAELVGLLGTEAEVTKLCATLDGSPTPGLLRGLGLSGRPAVLEICALRFEDENTELRAAARASLQIAAGRSFDAGPEAKTWLAAQSSARLLGGAARSNAQVLATLASADVPVRRALARELVVRSRGRLHLDVDTSPAAWRRQLEQLDGATGLPALDLERGFPWS